MHMTGLGVKFRWHRSAIVADAKTEINWDDFCNVSRPMSESWESGISLINEQYEVSQFAEFIKFFAALKSEYETYMTVSGTEVPCELQKSDGKLPVFRCLTAGTSGTPTPIRRTHQSWIKSFLVNSRLWELSERDRYGLFGNLSHSLSLYAAVEAVHIGAELHLLSGLAPSKQMMELRKREVTVLYATPVQLNLVQAVIGKKWNFQVPSLRLLLIGGSKLKPHHWLWAEEIFPNAKIYEFYGSSETSFIALGDKNTPDGFVGQTYPHVKVMLDQGACNEVGGLISVKSPYTAIGYAPNFGGTAKWHNGVVTTSDLGEMSPRGDLRLLGRNDRRVKIADQLVSPEEVETCILQFDGVAQVSVISTADDLRNASLVAIVQPSNDDLLAGAVDQHCRERLDPTKRPRKIVLVKDWPILPSGKTDHRALQKLLEPYDEHFGPET